MADSSAFEAACACLEKSSSLTNLQARGTIRLALKEAGFEAKTASPQVLGAVVRRVLPAELRSLRVDDPEGICTKIALALEGMNSEPAAETAEAVFKRLGGV
jgi:hypothetical protein